MVLRRRNRCMFFRSLAAGPYYTADAEHQV